MESETSSQRNWSPLNAAQRRVFGVLVEKAKTTPDAYPLTLNSATTGCNQKSNRSPQTNYSPDNVQETLDSLRGLGAVAEVQTGGRMAKYRHYAYEWLGVDKTELAVVAELLLRGPQSLGELRGRAARMEAIADLAALRPVIDGLIEKELVIELSPAGRGQLVTHGLYPVDELQRVRERTPEVAQPAPAAPRAASSGGDERLKKLETEVAELRDRIAALENRLG
ncbi:MAG: DUF480 domain-containing protein [Pirellulaceae bacterium]|nr:DUF480 domain-containing protein [Pirellulaceae bacterium]